MSSDTEVQDLLVTLSRAVTSLVQQQQALTGALRGLRDDLADSHEQLRREWAPVKERVMAIESALGELASQDDLRRGNERMLGEVKAIEDRLGGISEDVRVLRVLRDRVDALADGVDGVRQLAARSATSQQMADMSRELGSVLAEIAAARSQVVHIEQPAIPAGPPVTERLRQFSNSVLDDLRKRRRHPR